MHLFQTTAIIVALQGLLALTKFQGGNAYGTFVLVVTAFYAALTYGLWKKAAWVIIPGGLATLAQTIVLSTQTFSWNCFVGLTVGVLVKLPAGGLPLRVFGFGLHGVRAQAARGGFLPGMPGTQDPGGPIPCFGVNGVAVYVLMLLILCWRGQRQTPKAVS